MTLPSPPSRSCPALRTRDGLAVALLVAATLFTPSALAQHDPVAAESLFREAREAAKKGDYAAACPKFAESQRLDPAPGTVFNLADCEERTGKIASAWQHYRQAQAELPKGDDRAAASAERAQKLEKRLPRLTLRLAGAPSGTKVLRDGVELGAASLGVALPADPGSHTLVVRLPSGKASEKRVDIAEGQALTVDLTVPEDGGAPPPKRTQDPPPGTSASAGPPASPTLAYVALGTGGVLVVVGAVTGAMVLSKKSTFEAECDAQKVCSQKGLDAASSGKKLGTISTVSFALGAVGVGVGSWMLLRGDGTSTSVSARVSPSTVGLGLERTF